MFSPALGWHNSVENSFLGLIRDTGNSVPDVSGITFATKPTDQILTRRHLVTIIVSIILTLILVNTFVIYYMVAFISANAFALTANRTNWATRTFCFRMTLKTITDKSSEIFILV